MKVPMKHFAGSMLLAFTLVVAGDAGAAALQLADKPLFLGYTVNPNVFFELDDSGSMDFEITAVAHWDACRYDNGYPAFASGSCYTGIRDSGEWNASYYQEKKKATDTAWAMNGSGTYAEFDYIFNNNAVNFYGDNCDDSNTNIPSCSSTGSNTTESETIKGAESCRRANGACSAPSGGYCEGSGTSKICYQADTVNSYTINNRQSLYSKDWRVYSSDFNVTYYNPNVTYSPWVGTGMTDASFAAVRANPDSSQTGYSTTRNLGTTAMGAPFAPTTPGFIYEVWTDSHGFQTTISGVSTTSGPDKYDRTTGANGMVDVWDNHTRYVVTATTITKYDITYSFDGSNNLVETVGGPTVVTAIGTLNLAQVQQNIANWYQYSRRRMFIAKGAMAYVINQNNKFRFGITVINKSGNGTGELFVEMPASTVTDYTSQNTDLITKLYQFPQSASGTPLLRGLDNAGRYYAHLPLYNSSGSVSTTTRTSPITEACQQNFTVLFTDGYWSDGSDPAGGIGDRDGDGYSTGSGSSIRRTALSDVARYYADHDLDSTKANNVPVGNTGTTTFQHMVTYTTAFGVQGELVDQDGDAANLPDHLVDSATGVSTLFTPSYSAKWGDNPWSSNTGKIDDMWHAAYNSGGDFFSSRTPTDLVTGLQTALRSIAARTGSSAAVAASSGSYQTSTALFLAKFTAGTWWGELAAFPIVTTGSTTSIAATPSWKASTRLDTLVAGLGYLNNRKVVSYNPALTNGNFQGKGVPFLFPTTLASADSLGGLGLTQLSDILPYLTSTIVPAEIDANIAQGPLMFRWLRGDRSLESATTYRIRESVLGDIVDSSPQYVAAPDRFYPDSIQSSSKYSTFRASQASRTPMVYVGANDGMLHAFQASDGVEQFAYIPNAVYKSIKTLSSRSYAHKYSVNSTPEVNDVFFDGAWHTVLVGGLGAGGQGIYALDITSPSGATEAVIATNVMWEFTDKNYVASTTPGAAGSNGDPNLGYTFSRPQLIKMANGKWMAVFGNGYNNTESDGSLSTSITGQAYLYFVDIGTGKLVKRINIPVGTTTTPNGLATVTSVDVDGDYVADYIYGGDLYGNLWRFDVSSSTPSDWALAYSGSPIFTTQSGQPITVKPAVARHPTGSGLIIYFGSGKYLEFNDAQTGGQTTQSLYAVWDNVGVTGLTYPVVRGNMQQQTILAEVNGAVRVTSNTAINWSAKRGWYMDLIYSGNNNGELIMTDPLVRGDRIIMVSLVPATTACEPGGSSWIYELDYASGSRMSTSPVDVNSDGSITAADNVAYGTGTVAGGGFKKDSIITSPTILADTQSGDKEHKVFSSSAGALLEMGESTSGIKGRRSWRQLR